MSRNRKKSAKYLENQRRRYRERMRDPTYREHLRQQARKRYNKRKERDPEGWSNYVRDRNFKKLYGISRAEADDMIAHQNGTCAVCGTVPDDRLHVDHCHQTGKIRKMLCSKCNTALGMVNDSKEILSSLIRYLEEHS